MNCSHCGGIFPASELHKQDDDSLVCSDCFKPTDDDVLGVLEVIESDTEKADV